MKREDIKAIFPEATDDQISAVLNQSGSEINAIRSQLDSVNQAANDANNQHTAAMEAQKTEYEQQIASLTQKLQTGMTEEEKLKAAIEAANQREAEFNRKSNTLDAKTIFVSAGLAEDDYKPLLKQVVVDDAKATKENAEAIVSLLTAQKEAVEKATKDAVLKGNPGLKGGAGESTLTKESFSKLSYAEMLQAKQENPDLVAGFLK